MIDLNKINKYLEKTLSLLALSCSIGFIFIIAWGLNKGFDFSDEGYVLSGFCNPHEICTSNFYQLFFNKLFNWFHPGLLFYRYLRFTAGLFACIFLYRAIVKKMSSNQIQISINNRYILISLLITGYLHSYSIYTSILSYDNIGLIIGVLFITTSLFILKNNKFKSGIYLIILFSLLFSLQLFTRFPTGLMLFPMTIAIIAISSFNLHAKAIFILLFSLLSFTIPLLLINIFYEQGIFAFINDYKQSIKLLENHSVFVLLEAYKNQLNYVFEQVFTNNKWYLITFFLSAIISRFVNTKSTFQYVFLLIQLAIIINLSKEIIVLNQYKSGIIYNTVAFEPFVLLVCSFLIFNLIHFSTSYQNPIQKWSLIIVLFFYPFISSVGTENNLPIQLLQYLFFWAILIYIIYQQSYTNVYVKIINQVFIFLFLILILSQTISGYIYHPYRNTSSLINNYYKTSNTKLKNILFDQKTSTYLSKFEKIVGVKPTDKKELQIIDFCKIPGIVYALNGYTPRNAWMQIGLVKYNSYMFRSMKHDFTPDYIFLSNNPNRKSEFQEYFQTIQIPFETDYIFIDSIEHPLFGYEPMPINEYIYIYSKKEHANK